MKTYSSNSFKAIYRDVRMFCYDFPSKCLNSAAVHSLKCWKKRHKIKVYFVWKMCVAAGIQHK